MEDKKLKKEIERIFSIFKTSEGEIKPHFILTGPSGSGKTHIISNLCNQFDVDYIDVNAAQLTKEGTAGNSLSKALTPLLNGSGNPVVCFVDEFDKLFISGNYNSELAHEVSTGVQNEFLKVLESNTTSVFGDYGKYIQVNTSKVLFVFAGAFNGEEDITIDRLREFGVKTEFLGRVGLAYSTSKLSIEFLVEILTDSPLLKQYLLLHPQADHEVVVKKITEYLTANYDNNTIGARLINTLIHQYFIKGGKLDTNDVKRVSFQKTLDLEYAEGQNPEEWGVDPHQSNN